jgi:hypothetical protein
MQEGKACMQCRMREPKGLEDGSHGLKDLNTGHKEYWKEATMGAKGSINCEPRPSALRGERAFLREDNVARTGYGWVEEAPLDKTDSNEQSVKASALIRLPPLFYSDHLLVVSPT